MFVWDKLKTFKYINGIWKVKKINDEGMVKSFQYSFNETFT